MRISDGSSDVCSSDLMIRDREGVAIQQVSGRSACVIQFLQGISLTQPTPAQCEAAGAALGAMHRALETYAGARENSMGHRHWRAVAEGAGNLDAVLPGLQAIVADELRHLGAHWPSDLRSEEHTSELQSLMRLSYAVFFLKNKIYTLH